MRSQFKNIVIFSAEKNDRNDLYNAQMHMSARILLEDSGLAFTEVVGSYKGLNEKSFLVVLNDIDKDYAFVRSLAESAQQESILFRDNENNARLDFLTGDHGYNLGQLVEVSKNEAMTLDNYTYVPSTNKYFTTK